MMAPSILEGEATPPPPVAFVLPPLEGMKEGPTEGNSAFVTTNTSAATTDTTATPSPPPTTTTTSARPLRRFFARGGGGATNHDENISSLPAPFAPSDKKDTVASPPPDKKQDDNDNDDDGIGRGAAWRGRFRQRLSQAKDVLRKEAEERIPPRFLLRGTTETVSDANTTTLRLGSIVEEDTNNEETHDEKKSVLPKKNHDDNDNDDDDDDDGNETSSSTTLSSHEEEEDDDDDCSSSGVGSALFDDASARLEESPGAHRCWRPVDPTIAERSPALPGVGVTYRVENDARLQRVDPFDLPQVSTVLARGAEMAELAGAIYCNVEETRQARFLEQGHVVRHVGLSSCHFCWALLEHYGSGRQTVVVRGFSTDARANRNSLLLEVVQATPRPFVEDEDDIWRGLQVHGGLLEAARTLYQDIMPLVEETVQQGRGKKTTLCGHSLGGSLSILLLLLMVQRKGRDYVLAHIERVFTFGSPPVCLLEDEDDDKATMPMGEDSCCAILQRFGLPSTMVFGFVQPLDPIPRLFSDVDPLYPLICEMSAPPTTKKDILSDKHDASPPPPCRRPWFGRRGAAARQQQQHHDDNNEDDAAAGGPATSKTAQQQQQQQQQRHLNFLRPFIAATIAKKWGGEWEEWRQTYWDCARQRYRTVGTQFILAPAEDAESGGKVTARPKNIRGVLRTSPAHLLDVLCEYYPLESNTNTTTGNDDDDEGTNNISELSWSESGQTPEASTMPAVVGIHNQTQVSPLRGVLHHFTPAYRVPLNRYLDDVLL